MPTYPAYVQRLLAQARQEGQWYCGQPEAAALCFDILALFPDHRQAAELIYDLFCDEWLIYDNRVALQRHIDEWDDRPWQQRRRLALSFRFMSRWAGWQREYEPGYEPEREGPADVSELLQEGYHQLLEAYCLGDHEGANRAWIHFAEAVEKSHDRRLALLWIGKLYANQGFFADAAEVLTELCSRFNDESARRLLAEVRWWRDNAHRLPWIPPAGDGSRYQRMMAVIDPDAPTDEEVIQYFRSKAGRKKRFTAEAALDPDLAALIDSASATLSETPAPHETAVDWGFLGEDDGQPGELPDWVERMMAQLPAEMADDMAQRHRWTRPIQPPSTPPRYDPNEPPFDPDEFLSADELF